MLVELEADVRNRRDSAEALGQVMRSEARGRGHIRDPEMELVTIAGACDARTFGRGLKRGAGLCQFAFTRRRTLQEHRAKDVGPLQEVGRPAGEANLALLHEHRAFSQLQSGVDRLLHQDDGGPARVDLAEDSDQLRHDDRRQPQRQLVHQEQARLGDEGLSQAEHLLLPA